MAQLFLNAEINELFAIKSGNQKHNSKSVVFSKPGIRGIDYKRCIDEFVIYMAVALSKKEYFGIDACTAIRIFCCLLIADDLKDMAFEVSNPFLFYKRFNAVSLGELFTVGWSKEIVKYFHEKSGWDENIILWNTIEENGKICVLPDFDNVISVIGDIKNCKNAAQYCTEYAENKLYIKLKRNFPEYMYSDLREYFVTHPYIGNMPVAIDEFWNEHLEEIKNGNDVHLRNDIDVIFSDAYEIVSFPVKECPCCQWLVETYYNRCPICNTLQSEFVEKQNKYSRCYRLKYEPMRFWAYPGILEIQIRNIAINYGFEYSMYPNLDRYDVKIITSDEIFLLDAKQHNNIAKYIISDMCKLRNKRSDTGRKIIIVDDSSENRKIISAMKKDFPLGVECMTVTKLEKELAKNQKK